MTTKHKDKDAGFMDLVMEAEKVTLSTAGVDTLNEKIEVSTTGVATYLRLVLNCLEFQGLGPVLRKAVLTHLASVYEKWDMSEIEPQIAKASKIAEKAIKARGGNMTAASRSIRPIIGSLLPQIATSEIIDRVFINAGIIGDIFGISEAEKTIVALSEITHSCPLVDSFLDSIINDSSCRSEAIQAITGAEPDEASVINDGKSRISRNWIVEHSRQSVCFNSIFSLHYGLARSLHWDPANGEDILNGLLKSIGSPSLYLEDFSHLRDHIDIASALISNAVKQAQTGVNILIYGPPGTGKTEVSQLLSQVSGLSGYAIGEGDGMDEVSRDERLQDLFMAEALLSVQAETSRSFMVFDEMEDITVYKTGEGSKIVMNRFMDANRVPVVWIANDIDSIPDYLIRRMMMTIEISRPPVGAQRKILQNIAAKYGIELSEKEGAQLQSACEVIPAVAKNAARSASLSGGGADHLRRIYLDINGAMRGEKLSMTKVQRHANYDPDMSVTDVDLTRLTKSLVGSGNRDVSFVFSGAPGTGKSAAARHIAERMGLRIIERKGSDLFGSYVGETEKAIKAAFEEARDEGAALIFDEIDSLLSDRKGHQRGFETSQVNELLKCLEDHPEPIFGCTNLVDNLDPAAMRRFTFKVKFDVLDSARAARCFEAYLGFPPPASLSDITGMVPSDFSVVKKRAHILGVAEHEEIVKMIAQEVATRAAVSRPIGFRA